MKIFNIRIGQQHNGFVRGFKTKDDGTIVDSWTFQRLGNGGLVNDESAAKQHIGHNIDEYEDHYEVKQ